MNEGRKLGMNVERELKKKKKIELHEREFDQQFLSDILLGLVFGGEGLQNFIGICF